MLPYRGDDQGLRLKGVLGKYATTNAGAYTWRLTVCDFMNRCDSADAKAKFKQVNPPKPPKSELNSYCDSYHCLDLLILEL